MPILPTAATAHVQTFLKLFQLNVHDVRNFARLHFFVLIFRRARPIQRASNAASTQHCYTHPRVRRFFGALTLMHAGIASISSHFYARPTAHHLSLGRVMFLDERAKPTTRRLHIVFNTYNCSQFKKNYIYVYIYVAPLSYVYFKVGGSDEKIMKISKHVNFLVNNTNTNTEITKSLTTS